MNSIGLRTTKLLDIAKGPRPFDSVFIEYACGCKYDFMQNDKPKDPDDIFHITFRLCEKHSEMSKLLFELAKKHSEVEI